MSILFAQDREGDIEEDQDGKKRGKLIGVIDLEYNQEYIQEEYKIHNKVVKKLTPSEMFLGMFIDWSTYRDVSEIKAHEDEEEEWEDETKCGKMHFSPPSYLTFDSPDIFFLFIESFRDVEIILYTYFMSAELIFFSRLDCIRWMIDHHWIIKDLSKWEVKFVNEVKNIHLCIRDIRRITNTSNLDDMCKAFLSSDKYKKMFMGCSSPKDILLKFKYSDEEIEQMSESERKRIINYLRENLYKELTEEQRKLYNKYDCMMTYYAYLSFMQGINYIASQLGVKALHPHTLYSLGQISRCMLNELERKVGSSFLEWEKLLERGEQDQRKKKKDVQKQELNNKDLIIALLKIGREMYQGGGITTNLLHLYQDSKELENAVMYDVNSLYPHSALLAAYDLSENSDDYVILSAADLKKGKYNDCLPDKFRSEYDIIAMEIEGSWTAGSIYLLPQRVKLNKKVLMGNLEQKEEIEELYKTVYCREVQGWFSTLELSEAEQVGFRIKKIKSVLLRKKQYQHIRSVEKFMRFFLEQKSKLKKEDNPALYEITKLLMNVAYGKITEKRTTNITNHLFSAFLTSYSRAIMISLFRHITKMSEQGCRVYHFATDSIICSPCPELERALQEWEKLWQSKLRVSWSLYKKEVQGRCVILSLKRYAFYNEKGEVVKEAHLAVSTRKPTELWTIIDREMNKRRLDKNKSMADSQVNQQTQSQKEKRGKRRERTLLAIYLQSVYFLSFKEIWDYITRYGSKHSYKCINDMMNIVKRLEFSYLTSDQQYMFITLLLGAGLYHLETYFFPFHDLKLKLDFYNQFTVNSRCTRQWHTKEEFLAGLKSYEKTRDKILKMIKNPNYKPKQFPEWFKRPIVLVHI